MSLSMGATSALIRLKTWRAQLRGPVDLFNREYPEPAPIPPALRRQYDITETTVADRPVLRLTPRGAARATGHHMIYTHGGGYVLALQAAHWRIVEGIARDTGATVTVPLYRLAPEGSVDEAYDFLQTVYEKTAAEAGDRGVTLAGDSAGGGLAVGQAVAYRDRGLPPPRQVVALAPWLDLSLTHPGIAAVQPHDVMLQAERLVGAGTLWAAGNDLRDPRLSPLHADPAGLPPVHLFQGGRDILAPDTFTFAARLTEAGNKGSFHYAPTGIHVYPGAVRTPEARRALATVRGLLRAA
ncbi:alpha/beta hydrolase [Streptomyces sp. A7024]|uniref:Alpha/beta hydrolase n=1 Tax=Streptomyces coryli TaxID=1128680 RepID=A0A6G4U034_9ACTN|nr:alpha/beta hydrolase [Streptomyces coryli]NGN64738.1 alpha/beta hydrolase [Streptomyces coryli]